MQIINCTYRGPRARYYVSKPYPYYTADQLTVGMEALGGFLKMQLLVCLLKNLLLVCSL